MAFNKGRCVYLSLADVGGQAPATDFDQEASDFSEAFYYACAILLRLAVFHILLLALPNELLKGGAENCAKRYADQCAETRSTASLL